MTDRRRVVVEDVAAPEGKPRRFVAVESRKDVAVDLEELRRLRGRVEELKTGVDRLLTDFADFLRRVGAEYPDDEGNA